MTFEEVMTVEEWKRKNPPIKRKPVTNYDLLVRKTPEELAHFMAHYDSVTVLGEQLAYERWLDWLKQEATDGAP